MAKIRKKWKEELAQLTFEFSSVNCCENICFFYSLLQNCFPTSMFLEESRQSLFAQVLSFQLSTSFLRQVCEKCQSYMLITEVSVVLCLPFFAYMSGFVVIRL